MPQRRHAPTRELSPPRDRGVPHRPGPTWRRVLALSGLVALTACGGGGGSTPNGVPTPTPSPPPPSPLPAQMSVPTPVGYDADHLAAFNRINELRVMAGLGMLAQDTRLDAAAQAHVGWMDANGTFSHVEVSGTVGFSGEHWWDRAESLGYLSTAGSEVISWGFQPERAVDSLVNAIYHRTAILSINPTDLGVGYSVAVKSGFGLLSDFVVSVPRDGSPRAFGQSMQSNAGGVVLWPIDRAVGVQSRMGNEYPNPVPDIEVANLGTPASIQVDPGLVLAVKVFEIREYGSGILVPTRILTWDTDPNGLIYGNMVAAIPLSPLTTGQSYLVHFSGSTPNREIIRDWVFGVGSQ